MKLPRHDAVRLVKVRATKRGRLGREMEGKQFAFCFSNCAFLTTSTRCFKICSCKSEASGRGTRPFPKPFCSSGKKIFWKWYDRGLVDTHDGF